MYLCVVLDDSRSAIERLRNALYAEEFKEMFTLVEFSQPEALYEYLRHNGANVDILFIDVILKDENDEEYPENGVKICRRIIADFPLIRVIFYTRFKKSSVSELGSFGQSFNLIVKPLEDIDLQRTLFNVLAGIESEKRDTQTLPLGRGGVLNVAYSDVISIESRGRTQQLTTSRGSFTLHSRFRTLAEFFTAERGFCIINKGVLINFVYVRSLLRDDFLLSNNRRLKIADGRKKIVKEAFFAYIGKKLPLGEPDDENENDDGEDHN